MEDIYIVVMGVAGAGKSHFIQLCSGSPDIKIGGTLKCCTKEIEAYTFVFQGSQIHLIDTPGLDDDEMTDCEILEEISTWFGTKYRERQPLASILYVHRISNNRMAKRDLVNLEIFKQLCGEDFYPRVSLMTTFWDTMELADASRFQEELERDPEYWADLIQRGSRAYRHDCTGDSALKILSAIVGASREAKSNGVKPYTKIQKEVGQDEMTLGQTSAGQVIGARIIRDRDFLTRKSLKTEKDIDSAISKNDKGQIEMHMQTMAATKERLDKNEANQARLGTTLEENQLRHAEEVSELREELDAHRQTIENLQADNRAKSQRLRHFQPDDADALVLYRAIQKNQDEIKVMETQVEKKRRRLKKLQEYVSQGAAWIKENPEAVKRMKYVGRTCLRLAFAIYERREQSQQFQRVNYNAGAFSKSANQAPNIVPSLRGLGLD